VFVRKFDNDIRSASDFGASVGIKTNSKAKYSACEDSQMKMKNLIYARILGHQLEFLPSIIPVKDPFYTRMIGLI
jgi:hypothetical protein